MCSLLSAVWAVLQPLLVTSTELCCRIAMGHDPICMQVLLAHGVPWLSAQLLISAGYKREDICKQYNGCKRFRLYKNFVLFVVKNVVLGLNTAIRLLFLAPPPPPPPLPSQILYYP